MTVKSPVWAAKALLVTNEVCLACSLFSTTTRCPSLQRTSRLASPRADGEVSRNRAWAPPQRRVTEPREQTGRSLPHGFVREQLGRTPRLSPHSAQRTSVPSSRQTSLRPVLEGLTRTPNRCRPPDQHACPHPDRPHPASAVPLNKQSGLGNREAFFWLGPSVCWPCLLPRCRGEHEVITPSEYEV